MAVAIFINWAGISVEQYEHVRKAADWEGNPAPGGILHVAAFDDQGLHVTDVWETVEDFQNFIGTRVGPAMAEVGVTEPPPAVIIPAHAVFIPGLEKH